MTAVPRFYQNLYQKINSSFIKTTGFKKFLINQTVRLGKKKLNNQRILLIEKCCDGQYIVYYIILCRNRYSAQIAF
jgi:long-subunit acyl-CoA synthetase (AMP-forming)